MWALPKPSVVVPRRNLALQHVGDGRAFLVPGMFWFVDLQISPWSRDQQNVDLVAEGSGT